MKRNILPSFFLLVAILTLHSCSEKPAQSEPVKSKYHEAYEEILHLGTDRGFPGFIMAVQAADEPAWAGARGVSSIERNSPIQSNDRFHIASVTKLFTSIVILQLIDEKKLDFESKVIEFLDTDITEGIPNIDRITVGQLLDHSSGIYSFNNDLEYLNTIIGPKALEGITWSNTDLLQLANSDRSDPLGEPGSGHYYSDANTVLLSEIASHTSGKPFRQLISEKIIHPLQLNNTGFYAESIDDENFTMNLTVQGYLKRSEVLDNFLEIHPSFQELTHDSSVVINTTSAVERIDAGAGIVSSADDLLKVGQALYKGHLVSENSLEWLLSIGENIEQEPLHTKRQGIVTVRNKPYGTLFTSLGDGPGGINSMLAYHPSSETLIVAYTNIFGNFDEHDFFIDEIIPRVLSAKEKGATH